ncbi:hypothetical protein H6792_01490 [Candidatus Nomurabacteria bacterium]|nr:hypothetical protein [Candidatus Nomurabacteria bacterium]
MKLRLNLIVVSLMIIVGWINLGLSPVSQAAISNWQAGNIISDSNMTAKDSMTATQIQNFLNSKVTNCDTQGQATSELNNSGVPDYNGDGKIQRWEFGKYHHNQTTFTCLKDYRAEDGRTAAQVIYDTAQQYQINPQVLLVLIQKEQSLITDAWPFNIQYRSATGYGCPDTAVCDQKYYGLINQIKWAATMFNAIMTDSPNWYTPYILGNNYIQYNPNAACGGSTVNIQNRATKALYNYTPYQPNQAALDAGWGTANCGAYGNRNFFLYYSSWFGQPNTGQVYSYSLQDVKFYSDSQQTTQIGVNSVSLNPGSNVYIKVTVKNTGNQVWQSNTLRLGTINPDNHPSDLSNSSWISNNRPTKIDQTTVKPGELGSFSFMASVTSSIGQYQESFSMVDDGVRWFSGSIPINYTVASATPYYQVSIQNFDLYYDASRTLPVSGNSPKILAGNKLYASIKLKNTGNQVFPKSISRIATTNPLNRISAIKDQSWLSSNRASNANEGDIQPGQSGSFNFSITAPNDPGVYSEQFGFVVDGIIWVNDNIGGINLNVESRPQSMLGTNQSITTGQTIASTNGRLRLILQDDGNLVTYDTFKTPWKPIWSARTVGSGANILRMQSDGNLVLYNKSTNPWKPIWHTKTPNTDANNLVMQDDGNLVLYFILQHPWLARWSTQTFTN